MSGSASEIETIVRLVVERLQAMAISSTSSTATNSTSESPSAPEPPQPRPASRPKVDSDPSRLILHKSLITLEQLHRRSLKDVRVVEVGRRAIVTPAVKDELRSRGVQLKRAMPTYPAVADAEILLIASAAKSLRHSRVVSELIETNVDATAELGNAHLVTPERCVIWCSRTPYAAHQAVCRYHKVRSSLLMGLNDLERAQTEVNPNLLVLDDRRWSLADLNTLVHQWQVET